MAAQGLKAAVLLLAALPLLAAAQRAVIAEDDDGHLVTLPQPARRVVSLAPQTTELLFAAGAGAQVVATVAYANHPAPAQRLPQVGDTSRLDLRAIAAAQPDLIVAWPQGHTAAQWQRLKELRVPIYVYRDPGDWRRLPITLRQFGALTGRDQAAQAAAADVEARLRALLQQARGLPPLPVFVQLWHRPLTTAGGDHAASGALALCGASNALAVLEGVAQVQPQAVLAAGPQAMVVAEAPGAPPEALTAALAYWRDHRAYTLVNRRLVLPVSTEVLTTPLPRTLQQVPLLCEGLARVRAALALPG